MTNKTVKKFLEKVMDDSIIDKIIVIIKTLKNADLETLKKLKELNIPYYIEDLNAVITVAEIFADIYYEEDNYFIMEVDISFLQKLITNFGDRLKLFLEGNGREA